MTAHILVVDDEPGIRKMFRTVLQNYGYTMEEAANAEDAMARLATGHFDVMITDVNMPVHDGLELVHIAHEYYPRMPVIVMTGKPVAELPARARRDGAYRVLVKPIMPATLKLVIEAALR